MRVLFVRGHVYAPEMVGGVERNTQSLCRRLRAEGVVCAGLSALSTTGWASRLNRIARKLYPPAIGIPDPFAGHPVYRYWVPAEHVDTVMRAFRPDIVVVQDGERTDLVHAFAARGVPVVCYQHGVDFRSAVPALAAHPRVSFMACSRFVADRMAVELGLEAEVILPIIETADYETPTTRREVLLINPRHDKGVDIAWALAEARRDIAFRFAEAWDVPAAMHDDLVRRAKALGNVTIMRPQRQVRPLLAEARVLLAPCRLDEGHPRAISEAQISGIPALCSDRGGVPECVGPGGVVLPLGDDPAPWVATLSRMWDDPAYYAGLAEAARRHAQRASFAPEQIAGAFLAHLRRRVAAAL